MTAWKNRIIETRNVSTFELRANPLNWRRHPQPQAEAIKGLLGHVGIVAPLLAYHSERAGGALTLIDGHMRLETGGEWPCTILDVDDREADMLLATFDPITGMAEMDAKALGELLAQVDMVAVEDEGLSDLLAQLAEQSDKSKPKVAVDAEPLVDRAEELQAKWGVQSGDVWQIGRHFLICGDCRELNTWQRLLGAAGVDAVNGVFTSPPYAEQRKEQYGGVPADEYVDWWEAMQANVRVNLAGDGSFFINIKPHCEDGQRVLYVMDLVCAMVRRWQWRLIDENAWVHQGFPGEPQRRFQNAWEPIYCFAAGEPKFRPDHVAYVAESVIQYEAGLNLRQRERGTTKFSAQSAIKHSAGKAYPRNVLKVSSANTNMPDHAAAFPLELPDFFIRSYSDSGDIWLDPFLGSGTTIVAAHGCGRQGLGIERIEKYCAIALQRLETVTGQLPVRIEEA